MSYPQQPGNWNDPGVPGQQPTGYPDPAYQVPAQPDPAFQVSGQPDATYQTSGQPGNTQPYPAAAYPAYGYPVQVSPPTNAMAIAALVCAIAGVATCITAPVGAILGHVARKQIRERGEGGDGMALAGIIVGWIVTGLMLLLIAFYVVMFVVMVGVGTAANSSY